MNSESIKTKATENSVAFEDYTKLSINELVLSLLICIIYLDVISKIW